MAEYKWRCLSCGHEQDEFGVGHAPGCIELIMRERAVRYSAEIAGLADWFPGKPIRRRPGIRPD